MRLKISKSHISAMVATLLFATAQYSHAADAADHRGHNTESKVVQGLGVVQYINAETDMVTLSHEPIPELNWPAMTMQFKVAGNAEETLEAGEKVRFELTGEGTDVTITKIEKAD